MILGKEAKKLSHRFYLFFLQPSIEQLFMAKRQCIIMAS